MTNHELAALIEAAGRSHAALARKVNIATTVGAGFDWHFTPVPGTAAIARRNGTRAVGLADVERIRQARAEFETLDRVHGGGHAFTWLADYLDREVAPLLAGHYSAPVGRELFAAASSLTELAGFSSAQPVFA